MAGYAARRHPSQGVGLDLHAKALALEDEEGRQVVLVTLDLLGFRSEFTDRIAAVVEERTGLKRDQLLFNASHTHGGPVLEGVLGIAYEMSSEEWARVGNYTDWLGGVVAEVIQEALSGMEPCKLSTGFTEVSFAANRRVPTRSGYVIGANRLGPVDHRVPVLAIDTDRGVLKAVVFGYSCHNTTLQGDNYQFHGDYAGVAQAWLENRHPRATALFVTGAAGDANPYPRGTVELAEEHGVSLARAVDQALTGPLVEVSSRLRTALARVTLQLQEPPSREEFEARLRGENVYHQKHARHFLDILEKEGEISRDYQYPVQVLRLGDQVDLVALGGELVLDYALRLRRELKNPDLWVAGYSNDVSSYIPSRRVLEEGGYEAEDSMIYYGQPASFDDSVEGLIVEKVKEVFQRLDEGE